MHEIERAAEARVAVCMRVDAGVALRDCWCVSLGIAGLEVAGVADGAADAPAPGARLRLAVHLPGGETLEDLALTVEWAHERWNTVVLGGSFDGLQAAQRAAIERLVAAQRPRVAVIGTAADRVARSLLVDADIELVQSVADRAAYAAVVVCPDGPDEAERRLRWLAHRQPDGPRALDLLRRVPIEAPLVLHADRACLEAVLPGHCAGVFRAVEAGDGGALEAAVRAALEDHAARRAAQRIALAREPEPPRSTDRERALGTLVYESRAMADVMTMIERAAPHTVPVLLTGETGTGKGVLARALHDLGPRAAKLFVAQDCGAVSEHLLESELFGHVKGAFTGALANHAGLFAAADGGTIFLDEIENISAGFQAKLLRVLETGEIRPVGATVPRRVDVRVVAASNRDLKAEVDRGSFRGDLYYRLHRFAIQVPALRERRADILPIARHFVARLARELGAAPPRLAEATESLLVAHDWPGNVRELRNVIERALLMTLPGDVVQPAALDRELVERAGGLAARGLRAYLAEIERAAILEALERHQGVLSHAARALQMDAVTLARRARRVGVRLSGRRPPRHAAR